MSARLLGLALAFVLAAGGLAPARAAEPIRRDRLSNGLTILVRENPSVPVVAVSVTVRVGSRWETSANAGITNLLQQVMVKGTPTRTALQIAEEAEEIGGGISASGDVDMAEVRGVALSRNWQRLLELLADVTLRPTLPENEIESERRSVQSAIKSRADQPFQRAYDAMMERVYGPHAYALPVLGRGPVVARVDRAALLAHYRRFYRGDRTIVSVSGDIAAGEMVAEVRRLFGALPASEGSVAERPMPPAPAGGRDLVTYPAAQAQVMVAFLGPGIGGQDYATMKVLSVALGGGMAGRLFTELRDKQGLAYSTGAINPSRVDSSVLLAYLGTAPANADRAEEGMLRELARMSRERVTPEELARAKSFLLGQFNLDRRTNARLAWYQAFFEATGVGYDFAERYVKAVEGVTADDVLRVAQTYLAAPAIVTLRPAPR